MRACPGPGCTGGYIIRVQITTIGIGNDVIELCIQVTTGQGFVARPGFYSAVGCHNLP